MTLILKSNRVATASIGNVHGFEGPMDFRAMLDFNRDEYFIMTDGDREDYELADAVVTARASSAEYRDLSGNYLTAPANTPRLHYMPDIDLRGLMSEPTRQNFVASPNSPPSSQSVSIASASNATRVMLTSWGSGSASLTGTGLTLEATLVLDDRTIKAYSRTIGAITATLDITGTVSRVQVENGLNQAAATSFTTGTRGAETSTLGSAFASLLSTSAGTVVGHYVGNPTPVTAMTFVHGLLSIQNSGQGLGGLHLTASQPRDTGSGTNNLITVAPSGAINSGTTRASLNGPYSRHQTAGISYSGDDLGLIQNRQGAQAADTGFTLSAAPNKVTLAGGILIASTAVPFAGILARAVIYDRVLTADELRQLAGAWG